MSFDPAATAVGFRRDTYIIYKKKWEISLFDFC